MSRLDGFMAEKLARNLLIKIHNEFVSLDDKKDPEYLRSNVNNGDGFGELLNDTDITMDYLLGRFIINELLRINKFRKISVEGFKDIICPNSSTNIWVCIDPLDGSLNYKSSFRYKDVGNVGISLPYTAIVTILDTAENPKFKNIIASGILDLRDCGAIMLAHRTEKNIISRIYFRNFKPSLRENKKIETLDIKNNIVFIDNYYKENREIAYKIFGEDNGWVRNTGSSGYEMMMTALGISKAFISKNQKQHELGAGYLLIKSIGGMTIDFEANDLSEQLYQFNAKTSCILTINERLAMIIWSRIHKAENI